MKEYNEKEARARIGLFWFSQDYSGIIKTEGELEICDEDLLKPGRLDPIGVHAEYDMPKNVPRGRVNYENNVFRIWVGEDCLEEDEKLINLIKNYYNLTNIDSGIFKVKRHYHWNTKS
jgi:hypothetical protein